MICPHRHPTINGLILPIASFLLLLSTSFVPVRAFYGSTIFSEDFSDGIDDGWIKYHETGTITSNLWTIISLDKKYGMNIPWKRTAGNSYAGKEEWTDILWEFDMYPVEGVDRNFQFRVISTGIINDPYYFYELHFSGNNVDISKHAPSNPGTPVFPVTNTYNMANGSIYHWKVELVKNHYIISIKEDHDTAYTTLFNLYDTNLPVLHGKIGLRVGTGDNAPSIVYFDNIKVTDLTFLNPYYSQRNEIWKNNKYDFLKRTIEEVGCALSSVAMTLKYYDLNKVPWGDTLRDLNPGTLNDWLNAQQSTDSWWRNGNVSWQTITNLSQALNASNSTLYTKLEHKEISKTNSTEIHNTLTNLKRPLIVKYQSNDSSSGNHFVVAYKVIEQSPLKLQINDPYDSANATLSAQTALRTFHYFYPTESDFSYFYLNSDIALKTLLLNSSGNKTGQDKNSVKYTEINNSNYYQNDPLTNDLNPTIHIGDPYWHLNIKQPDTGVYQLQLVADNPGFYNFELYTYNQTGLSSLFDIKKIFVPSEYPLYYQLQFYHDNHTPVATLMRLSSFEYLRQLVRYSYTQGWIKDFKTRDQLLRHIDVAEKVYPKSTIDGKNILTTCGIHNSNYYRQGKIMDRGFDLIAGEINTLLSQL